MTDEKRKNKGEGSNENKNGWKPCGSTHTSLLNKKINKIDKKKHLDLVCDTRFMCFFWVWKEKQKRRETKWKN